LAKLREFLLQIIENGLLLDDFSSDDDNILILKQKSNKSKKATIRKALMLA
jgi:hypothetical protein